MEFNFLDQLITICGMRGSGKSYLTKHLIDTYYDLFQSVLIICPSNFSNFYERNKYNVVEEYHPKLITDIMDKMAQVNKDKNKRDPDFKHILIVLDDCIADINLNKSKELRQLVVRGRHFGISLLITTQYVKSVPPLVRNNTQYYFLSRQNRASLDIVEKELNLFKNKHDFEQMLSLAGQDYKFIIINTDAPTINKMYGIYRV